MAVSSNITTAPKIDRTRLMRDAWTQCKRWYEVRRIKFVFNKNEFRWALQCAWKAARAALKMATERRADAIRAEIALLAYRPVRINIEARRQALTAELAALA